MYREALILLPCHSLEDFPTYHEGEEAESLLACWTALWHPRFIASSHKMPQWNRVDDPPEDIEGKLILVPSISQQELPAGFSRRATESGATVIQRMSDREKILEKALVPFSDQKPIDEELAADFLALGYCYLQVELLTRQMRYSSSLDELYFNDKVVEAADALIEGELEKCKEALQACFDVLAEERNQFYSVDSYFIDIDCDWSFSCERIKRGLCF
jgi:alpha-mannosidase